MELLFHGHPIKQRWCICLHISFSSCKCAIAWTEPGLYGREVLHNRLNKHTRSCLHSEEQDFIVKKQRGSLTTTDTRVCRCLCLRWDGCAQDIVQASWANPKACAICTHRWSGADGGKDATGSNHKVNGLAWLPWWPKSADLSSELTTVKSMPSPRWMCIHSQQWGHLRPPCQQPILHNVWSCFWVLAGQDGWRTEEDCRYHTCWTVPYGLGNAPMYHLPAVNGECLTWSHW